MKISKIYTNSMGTVSFIGKLDKGMRKEQDFIVYPISKDSESKLITIQSHTRIGKIDLETGEGKMSQSHSNGAFFPHLQIDKLTPFQLSEGDTSALKVKVFLSSDPKAGKDQNGIIFSDNSGAINVL
jgi:hypothetical protein